MGRERIAIVGGGIAALTAAETIRDAGFEGDLTIVGSEPHAPYSRPALSKAALLETGEMRSQQLPDPQHGARELRGVSAVGLDRRRSRVELSDGSTLAYDGLVIASGARAMRFTDAAGEHTVRSLDDAIRLRERLAWGGPVIVLGGGPLAMELASGCVASGNPVTLVSRRVPLSAQVGPLIAGMLEHRGREAGVRFVRTPRIALREERGAVEVRLEDGSVLTAPTVVTAIGDTPNIEWLSGSGLLRGGELRVDRRGRVRGASAEEGIVAAGDVTAFPTPQGVRRVPVWTSAIDLAKVAAATLIAGRDAEELTHRPYFWTEQFGVTVRAVGPLPVEGDPEVIAGDPEQGSCVLRWHDPVGGGTAVAYDYRIPIPKLRAHAAAAGPAR